MNKMKMLRSFLLTASLLCAAYSAAHAQTPFKLNGELVNEGDVQFDAPGAYEISSDGNYVVYRADQDVDGTVELYSVRAIENATETKLNGALSSSASVFRKFAISPDSSTVAYFADQASNAGIGLYSVPIDGGTPKLLDSGFTAEDMSAGSLWFSADSSQVAYDVRRIEARGLYRASVTNGMPVRMDTQSMNDSGVGFVSISPDGTRVVYYSGADGSLYSVDFVGNSPKKVNVGIPTDGDINVFSYAFSGDGQNIVFEATNLISQVSELYSAGIEGTNVTRINRDLSADETISGFKLGSNADRVVYQIKNNSSFAVTLHSNLLDGSDVRTLDAVASGESLREIVISPDGEKVYYLIRRNTDNLERISSVPILGGQVSTISASNHFVTGFKLSPNSHHIVYNVFGDDFFPSFIYTSRTDQPSPRLLYQDVEVRGSVALITNDSKYVVLVSLDDFNRGVSRKLLATTIDGGELVQLDAPSFEPQNAYDAAGTIFSVSQNEAGSMIVFDGAQEASAVNELYAINLDFLPALFEEEEGQTCFPIVSPAKKIAVICL